MRSICISLILALLVAPERTPLRPAFNLFSAQQDVEIGKRVSQDAEKKLKLIHNSQASLYITAVGRQLVAKAPGERYPYQFKVVNDSAINAFAVPGGFLYINRGIFDNATNEAQLGGVMAHEISHGALRHGTNQVRLKFSRDAERQADLMGTQILYDSGHDPRAMAQFFEKIEAKSGSRSAEFFSDHPNPGNRISSVNQEIARLGGAKRPKSDSAEFQRIKRILKST